MKMAKAPCSSMAPSSPPRYSPPVRPWSTKRTILIVTITRSDQRMPAWAVMCGAIVADDTERISSERFLLVVHLQPWNDAPRGGRSGIPVDRYWRHRVNPRAVGKEQVRHAVLPPEDMITICVR